MTDTKIHTGTFGLYQDHRGSAMSVRSAKRGIVSANLANNHGKLICQKLRITRAKVLATLATKND
jgi:hypothetical protein